MKEEFNIFVHNCAFLRNIYFASENAIFPEVISQNIISNIVSIWIDGTEKDGCNNSLSNVKIEINLIAEEMSFNLIQKSA